MISETLENLAECNHDVCIVGAGPVGISLAVELDRLGLSVLFLESGTNFANPEIQELSKAEFADPNVHDDMSIAVARQLGGTSNLWGARCIKYDPIDFEPRPGLVDAKWPISYQDIYPYYAQACAYTRSGAPVYEAAIPHVTPTDNTFSFNTLERWANEQKLQVTHGPKLAASKNIDVRLKAVVIGIRFTENGTTTAIEIARPDGSQRRWCKIRSLVIAAGGLESTRLLLAAQRDAPDRFGGPNGPLGRYYMGHVIGEISDIIFNSATFDKAFDFFIDEHQSYVRRRFVASFETQLHEKLLNTAMWPVVPPVADARHQSGVLSSVYLGLAYGPLGRIVTAEAIRQRHIPNEPVSLWPHVKNLIRDIPQVASFIADFFRRRYFSNNRLPGFFVHNACFRYGLSYHAEQIPNPDSRVTLTQNNDRTGLPRLHIDLRFQEEDARSVVRTHELFAAWLVRTGIGHIEYRIPKEDRMASVSAQMKHGTHQIGTIRMGANRREAVVDKNLRSFDSQNLYVVSSAVLPTSGQANPTLTAIALALRLAATLAADAKGHLCHS